MIIKNNSLNDICNLDIAGIGNEEASSLDPKRSKSKNHR